MNRVRDDADRRRELEPPGGYAMDGAIRVGVVGLRRGMSIASVCDAREDVHVTAVCDRNRNRAEAAATQLDASA